MATTKDKKIITPTPDRPALFEFLVRSFDKDNFPDKIALCQASGRGCKNLDTEIFRKDYKPNAPQPTREQLIKMSNDILKEAQDFCNDLEKPQRFIVAVWNTIKSSSTLGRFLIMLRPTREPVDGDVEDFDEDGDEDGVKKDKNLADQMLARHKVMAQDHQWHMGDLRASLGQVMKLQKEMIDDLREENKEMRKERREMYIQLENARSLEQQRKDAAALNEVKLYAVKETVGLLTGLAPHIVNKITGEKTIPVKLSLEGMTVKKFLESMSEDEAKSAFGDFDEVNKEFRTPGIFTVRQTKILLDVSKGESPPEVLEGLFAGEDAITQDQMAAAQQLFGIMRLMPIGAMAAEMQKKKDAEAPPTNAPTPTQKPDTEQ